MPPSQTLCGVQSVFCACPPGQAQWTTRFFRALSQGCIPVTFFANCDLPYNGLGLDFSAFTVNVARHQLSMLNEILTSILQDAPRLRRMQHALADVQPMFSWDPQVEGNAAASITRMLQVRGATFKAAHSRSECMQPQQSVLAKLAGQEADFQRDPDGGNPFIKWNWVNS